MDRGESSMNINNNYKEFEFHILKDKILELKIQVKKQNPIEKLNLILKLIIKMYLKLN